MHLPSVTRKKKDLQQIVHMTKPLCVIVHTETTTGFHLYAAFIHSAMPSLFQYIQNI